MIRLLPGILCIFMVLNENLAAQHFTGLDKAESKKLAREYGFFQDNMTVKKAFNYLKFINAPNTKTLIVFFSENDIATFWKTICDYSEYDFVIKEFNEKHRKRGKKRWIYKMKDQKFEITIEEKEWYFVTRTKEK